MRAHARQRGRSSSDVGAQRQFGGRRARRGCVRIVYKSVGAQIEDRDQGQEGGHQQQGGCPLHHL